MGLARLVTVRDRLTVAAADILLALGDAGPLGDIAITVKGDSDV